MAYNKLFLRIILSVIIFVIFFIFYFLLTKYLFVLVLFIYLMIFYEVIKYFNYYNFFVFIYLFFSFLTFLYYVLFIYNKDIFLIFVLIIFLFDTFSYFFGKLFGTIKLIPKISPNKTLEGLIGGFLSSIIFTVTYHYLFNQYFILNFIIFNLLIVVFAFSGDLFQSFIKRKSKIKDSSNLLPGHGGFFDRMDGYLLAVFILPFQGMIL